MIIDVEDIITSYSLIHRNNIMTYLELKDLLDKLNNDQLSSTVTVFDNFEEEFLPVKSYSTSKEGNDVLDQEHFYLIF